MNKESDARSGNNKAGSPSNLYSYQRINNYILQQLEQGTCPWKCPWNRDFGKARNFVSQRVYSGYNRFILEFAGIKHGANEWLTVRQCNFKGGRIGKGEL